MNLALREEQVRLLQLLAKGGVRAQAVKGVNLVERLYPDLAWREVGDIDLLVIPDQARQAFDILRAGGLIPNQTWSASGLASLMARSVWLAPELVLNSPAGILVELHWDWPGENIGEVDLLAQPEAYLVYLCRHAGKHFWSRLKWSCDIELFRREFGNAMQWDLFWRLAKRHGAEASCAVSLELCSRWFEGSPAPGIERFLSSRLRRLADRAASEALHPAASRSHPVWTQLRLAPWRHRPAMVGTWLSPQPHEWNRAGRERWPQHRVWIERARHLWRRWSPHRAQTLSRADWGVLLEAYAASALAEAARRMLPVRYLLRRLPRAAAVQPELRDREAMRRVAWLVDVAANRQFFETRCLTRSLALAWMLRRRGAKVEVRLGVKTGQGQLQAHAWVEWQGEVLHDPTRQVGNYVPLTADASLN
jgi:hypothetical protein